MPKFISRSKVLESVCHPRIDYLLYICQPEWPILWETTHPVPTSPFYSQAQKQPFFLSLVLNLSPCLLPDDTEPSPNDICCQKWHHEADHLMLQICRVKYRRDICIVCRWLHSLIDTIHICENDAVLCHKSRGSCDDWKASSWMQTTSCQEHCGCTCLHFQNGFWSFTYILSFCLGPTELHLW